MSKLYIPEIGDVLTLAKPWTFNLYAERRNETLLKYFGYTNLYLITGVNRFGNQVWEDVLVPDALAEEKPQFHRNYPGDYHADVMAYCARVLETIQDGNLYSMEVTLPAGTKLKVDRIYIRKGGSEYSSISFTTGDLGSVVISASNPWRSDRKAKSLRFWAKLSECNNIDFN